MAPRIEGPSSSSVQDSSQDLNQGSTTTVQLGEHNLSQVADRLGVDKDDLLLANPQIKDPSKLNVGQDIRMPDKGKSSKADSDDGSHFGKTNDKGKEDHGPRLYGDPVAASAMKGKLDGTQDRNSKTEDVGSKHKDDSRLSPDEQAVKNAGGDKALKGYQQFKQAAAQVDKTAHDAVVSGKMKQYDDISKKLADHQKNPNPSQAERDEAAKLWPKLFELNKDPDVQEQLRKREGNYVETKMKELDDAKKKLEANPTDPKEQLEFRQKYEQIQKDLKPYEDAGKARQELENTQQKQTQDAIRKMAG